MRATGSLVGFVAPGGGLIQTVVGIGGNWGNWGIWSGLFLKRFGLAMNAASRAAWRMTRRSSAKP